LFKAVFGEEDFLVHQFLQELKKDFTEKNPQALVEVFDGGESPVEDFFLSLSQGGGLFVQEKMVILRDIFVYSTGDQTKILDFLKNKFGSSVNLLLAITWSGKVRSNKLLNYLKKVADSKEFRKKTSLEVEGFIFDKLKGLVSIEPGAVRKLANVLSENLWLLDRELEKLINFKSEGIITENDVDEMCDQGVSVKIFDLVDAIGNKNKKRAYALLSSLLNQGEDGFYVLSMMIFQVRNLALVLNCTEKGIFNSQEISQKTGLHSYVAQKTLAQSRGFSWVVIKEIYERAFLLDINSKSGKISIKEALEDFIMKV